MGNTAYAGPGQAWCVHCKDITDMLPRDTGEPEYHRLNQGRGTVGRRGKCAVCGKKTYFILRKADQAEGRRLFAEQERAAGRA